MNRLLITLVLLFGLAALAQCQSEPDLESVDAGNKEELNMSQVTVEEHKHTNALINESSPYLLSHAHNPVDWYPWGDEALSRARELDRPIFLSIGYASCHWCHVMERESFEDEEVAGFLNDHFISIKVDREQRPDLDHIYMAFTTAMTGSGGWPMSVFLTPELKPFFAGTYFPPREKYGRPGFLQLITRITETYRDNREGLVRSADDVYQRLSSHLTATNPAVELSAGMIGQGAASLMSSFDHEFGGFGHDRKFPHALELSLFLRHYNRSEDVRYLESAEQALTAMAQGGIHDHVGGGFARYAVDRKWLVPHFEKMLYDNSLLVPVYVEAYQLTGTRLYLDAVKSTLDFILAELTDQSGGFYSALDADSEGEEGKFYVWSKEEIQSVLGDNAAEFIEYFDVTDGGNFEGHNILNVNSYSQRVKQRSAAEDWDKYLRDCKKRLLEARSKRVRPMTDDKILTSWNGLALSALAKGYQITGEDRYLDAARENSRFVQDVLYRAGMLTHAYREGIHSQGLFLEDHAYYVRGLLDLYESDPSESNKDWLEFTVALADDAIRLFQDEAGTFYLRDSGHVDLIVRPKDEGDGATPSPGSIMIGNLIKLHRITDNASYLEAAEKGMQAISGLVADSPGGMSSALAALDYYLNDKLEFVVVGNGKERDLMLEELYRRYLPNRVIAISNDGHTDGPLFEGREQKGEETLAYVCRNSSCLLPASSLANLRAQLDKLR